MPESKTPYAAFADLLTNAGSTISPAELHGTLVGRSSAGAGFDIDPWLAEGSELLGIPLDDSLRLALTGLQEMVRNELCGKDMTLVLLLPDDQVSLSERVQALGQWCQGFLTGFGLTAREEALSGEAMEVLQDISAIAQIQSSLDDSEESENDYMEVTEYLRVAPMLLFTECSKPEKPEPAPSLH